MSLTTGALQLGHCGNSTVEKNCGKESKGVREVVTVQQAQRGRTT